MAIKYESAAKWGDVYYLKSDPDQLQFNLINVILTPGKPKLKLRHGGYDVVIVYECETSREPDLTKKLGIDNSDAENPDEEDE